MMWKFVDIFLLAYRLNIGIKSTLIQRDWTIGMLASLAASLMQMLAREA